MAKSNIEVKYYKSKNEDSKIKGFASICVGGWLVINGWKVVEGKNGLFVSAPSEARKGKDGKTEYKDIAYALTKEKQSEIASAILEAAGEKPLDF